ncbi:MAG: hypothetical protein HY060_11475 [Proteobacteria bacterium]|nr:hypothetical protein [Pseudomonadota bacterium]
MFPAVLAVSLFNGLMSPVLPIVVALAPVWMPEFIPVMPEFLFHGASLIVAFGTMLLGGVPAALWERITRQPDSDTTSMAIWLGAVAMLSYPSIARFL